MLIEKNKAQESIYSTLPLIWEQYVSAHIQVAKRNMEGIIKKLHNWLPYKGGDRLQTVGKGMRLFLFHSFKWFWGFKHVN